MPDLVPLQLVPPGVNDARSRAFAGALGEVLAQFETSALIVENAWTAPAAMLPALVMSAGLTEFVSPGMREDLLRALIADAPGIHAMTGTVAGTRRALAAIGVEARWTQWWQEMPKAAHDTHKVVLFLADTIIAGAAPLDVPNQQAAARIINAVKRWSQDIAVEYGMRGTARLYAGIGSRSGRHIRINAPQLGDENFSIPSFAGAGASAVRLIRIDAKA